MTSWFWLVAVSLILPFLLWFGLRNRPSWVKWPLSVLLLAIAIVLPYSLPIDLPALRFFVVIITFVGSAKIADTATNKITSPEMGDTLGRYLLWCYILQDSSLPADQNARKELFSKGVSSLLQALLYVALLCMVICLNSLVELHGDIWVSCFWMMWVFSFMTSAISAFSSGCFRLLGIEVVDVHHIPELARSPRDFWSRRWNSIFRNIAHRHLFEPLGGSHRPLLAASVVFIFSALIHEYLVFVALGQSDGSMAAFFLLHGAATIFTTILANSLGKKTFMPKPMAIAATIVWFGLTVPLFMLPLNDILYIDSWRFW